MPLAMNREVFITCAVTGSGGTQDRSPHVPRSPEQIAKSAIDAAKAGAAVVHCHVRDPETGKPIRMASPAGRFSGFKGEVRTLGPKVGQHTDSVLSDLLHYSPSQITTLRDKGIIK